MVGGLPREEYFWDSVECAGNALCIQFDSGHSTLLHVRGFLFVIAVVVIVFQFADFMLYLIIPALYVICWSHALSGA